MYSWSNWSNGEKYIWDGYLEDHFGINFLIKKNIPNNYFKFVWVKNYWIFDEGGLGASINFKELRIILKNNLDFLNQIAPIKDVFISNTLDGDFKGNINNFLNGDKLDD